MSTKQEKAIAREAAHQAVKCFDIKPDLASTVDAIEALQEYERTLRAGDTVTVDERFAFEQRWDERVKANGLANRAERRACAKAGHQAKAGYCANCGVEL